MTKIFQKKINLTKAESLEYIKKNKIEKIYIPHFFFLKKTSLLLIPINL